MRRAIGYIRVSTGEQADSGLSLESQRTKIQAFALAHDLELLDIVQDDISAKTLDRRPGIQGVLARLRRHEADLVIVAKLDRLTRSVRDLADLTDSGVEFASVAESIDTTSASGRLVINLIGAVAQWEREAIGERTSDALQAKARRGERTSRYAPYGFRFHRGAVVRHDHEQRGISLAHNLRGRGATLREISRRMACKGYSARTGRPLSPQVVKNILTRKEAA